jgi:hypothetical protein
MPPKFGQLPTLLLALDIKFSLTANSRSWGMKRGQGKDRRSTRTHPGYLCTPFTLGFAYIRILIEIDRFLFFVLSAFYVAMGSLANRVFL